MPEYSMLTFNLRWFMNHVYFFFIPLKSPPHPSPLITLVLEKEKLAVYFMISLFPTFCLFYCPLSLFIHLYCTCMVPDVAPRTSTVTNLQKEVQPHLQGSRPSLIFGGGGYRAYLAFPPLSYHWACASFDLMNYKIRIPPAKVDQISLLSGVF